MFAYDIYDFLDMVPPQPISFGLVEQLSLLDSKCSAQYLRHLSSVAELS